MLRVQGIGHDRIKTCKCQDKFELNKYHGMGRSQGLKEGKEGKKGRMKDGKYIVSEHGPMLVMMSILAPTTDTVSDTWDTSTSHPATVGVPCSRYH